MLLSEKKEKMSPVTLWTGLQQVTKVLETQGAKMWIFGGLSSQSKYEHNCTIVLVSPVSQ